MIDLTPLDVRKKKGDFRRTVRGYDPELVNDFLDMVAERLEELVKQNVALTERSEHLQEQVASYREREKALNEALVTAQQLRSEAQAQADREAELVRREAQSQAERIIEEGQRSFREIAREIDTLQARRRQFIRAFRTLLDGYLSELEIEAARASEPVEMPETAARDAGKRDSRKAGAEKPGSKKRTAAAKAGDDEPSENEEGESGGGGDDWLSSLVSDGEGEEAT